MLIGQRMHSSIVYELKDALYRYVSVDPIANISHMDQLTEVVRSQRRWTFERLFAIGNFAQHGGLALANTMTQFLECWN